MQWQDLSFNYGIRQILSRKNGIFKQFINNGKLQIDYGRF